MVPNVLLRLRHRSIDFLGRLRKPSAIRGRAQFGRLTPLKEQLGLLVKIGKLLDVAAFGVRIRRQVAQTLLFRPAAGHGKGAVRITRGHNARQDPACLVQSLLQKWRGLFAKAPGEFPVPQFGGGVCIIAQPANTWKKCQ